LSFLRVAFLIRWTLSLERETGGVLQWVGLSDKWASGRRMRTIKAIHSRIIDLYAAKIGLPAAELEFKVFLNRLWMSGAGGVALLAGILAEAAKSWVLGGISIASGLVMTAIFVRHLVLRHRFFGAITSTLKIRVDGRHPVRGLPNWRRQLSPERMKQLDEQYENWRQDRESAASK
jgi:hypothetical protein